MGDSGRTGPWPYPVACREGHEWGPGAIIVGWTPCPCAGGLGHQVVRCGTAGCREAWHNPPHAAGAELLGPDGEAALGGRREAWLPVTAST